MRIFDLKDKSGRNIYLSAERWSHINQEHPEVSPYLEMIKETLRNPVKISTYHFDENVKYYFSYAKEKASKAKHLLVIVKYLNGHGFIITAYFVRQMP